MPAGPLPISGINLVALNDYANAVHDAALVVLFSVQPGTSLNARGLRGRPALKLVKLPMNTVLAFRPTQLCTGDAADPLDPPSRWRTPRRRLSGPRIESAGAVALSVDVDCDAGARFDYRAGRASGIATVSHSRRDPTR